MADASVHTLHDLAKKWLPSDRRAELMQWNRFQLNAQTENSLYLHAMQRCSWRV